MSAIQDSISPLSFDGTVDRSWHAFLSLHEGAIPAQIAKLLEDTHRYSKVDNRTDWLSIALPRVPFLPDPWRPTIGDAKGLSPGPSCDIILQVNDVILHGASPIPPGLIADIRDDFPNHFIALESKPSVVGDASLPGVDVGRLPGPRSTGRPFHGEFTTARSCVRRVREAVIAMSRAVPARMSDWWASWRRVVLAGLSVTVIGLVLAEQLSGHGLEIADWDLLFLSGCITVICGLWLARGIEARFNRMLGRLVDRKVLFDNGVPITRDGLTKLTERLRDDASKWTKASRPAVAAILVAAFFLVNASRHGGFPLAKGLAGIAFGFVGGALVGGPIGRMIAYGLAPRRLSLVADADHVDEAAGLKPLGDYYFYQASLLAIPAGFLLAWSVVLLAPAWDLRYQGWREWYLGLLGVAICLEIAAFVVPLYTVHMSMERQKRAALTNADRELLPRIATLHEQLETGLTSTARAEQKELLEDLIASYRRIEEMPTWPIDPASRRRLTLGNLALIVPLITQDRRARALNRWRAGTALSHREAPAARPSLHRLGAASAKQPMPPRSGP
jgi:hypothetical protein